LLLPYPRFHQSGQWLPIRWLEVVCPEKERYRRTLVPSPEDRLCVKHGKPIQPSNWWRGCRKSGCCRCVAYKKKTRKLRAKKWESCFIPCIKHADRRCNRSAYVCNAARKCASCRDRLKDGTLRGRAIRAKNKWNYKQSMKLRGRLAGRLRGWALFERLTGFKIPDEWRKYDV